MLPLFRIWAVALYEMKSLARSTLFKVFLTLIALPVLLLFKTYSSDDLISHTIIAILYLLSPFVTVFPLFLAADSLIRNRVAGISETLYARPQSNLEFLFGKALGVFLVIFTGIAALLCFLAILTGVFQHTSFSLPGFLCIIPLMIAPTLATLIGTAFFFAALVRNKALTVTVLSAGFLAVTFFTGSYGYGLSDYAALRFPLMYSDFTGFGDVPSILEHRGAWLLAGISLVFLSALVHRRIPNSGGERLTALLLTLVCLSGMAVLGNAYISGIRDAEELRISMNALSRKVATQPRVTVTDCRIDLRHEGRKIEAISVLRFTNRTGIPVDRYTFTLNPGLEALEISRAETRISFSRKLHLITVIPRAPLAPGDSDSLTIRYRGRIDQDACWADLPEREWGKAEHQIKGAYPRFGFITPRFVLLTPECLWYPTSGAPYGSVFPKTILRDFTRFSLRVETAPKLTVISQGASAGEKPGVWKFSPETVLPQISICIGEYEKKAVTVDSVEYALYVKHGHDYYSRHFSLLRNTLPKIIHDQHREFYETYLGRSYPYPRLTYIEVPVHFYSFRRFWSVDMETQQPETVLLPEKGLGLPWASQFAEDIQRSRKRNPTLTPMEVEAGILIQFMQCPLLYTLQNQVFNQHYRRMTSPPKLSVEDLLGYSGTGIGQNWTIFPNYYRFTNAMASDSIPLIDSMMEMYLLSKSPSIRTMNSDFTIASYMLSGRSPGAVLSDPEFRDCGPEILKCASSVLFNRLEVEYGRTQIESFFQDFLKNTRERIIPADSLFMAFRERFGRDLKADAAAILNGTRLPACIVTDAKFYRISGPKGNRYQVRFTAYNPEPVEGTYSASVTPKSWYKKGRNEKNMNLVRYFTLPGGAAKEIGFVVDETFYSMGIDTFLSKNRPNSFSPPMHETAPELEAVAFEGERLLDHPPALTAPREIVVDNTDPGFQVLPSPEPSPLRGLLHRPESRDWELTNSMWYMKPPARWSLVVDTRFYGLIQKTARVIKAGRGESRVRWTADIPERGEYQLFYHTPSMKSFFFPDSRVFAKDFHFRVVTARGIEEQTVDLWNAEEGWAPVGSFSLPQGEAVVELSDKTKGAEVYADAVKWVRK